MFKWVRRSTITISLLLAIALWSGSLGWVMAQSTTTSSRLQTGQELYLESCSRCHVPLPPEVLPTQSWQKLLEKPQDHYGTSVNELIRLSQLLIWDYLQFYSRPVPADAPAPLYVEQSRYFKALHPRVQFSEPISSKSCIVCHPGAKQMDYQTLTPQWDDAP